MRDDRVNQFVVVLLVVFISAVFLSMIRSFLMAIFLAGIFSALAHPIYRRLNKTLKGRRSLASVLTLLLIIVVVLLPLAVLTGVVTGQAIKVSQSAMPWVRRKSTSRGRLPTSWRPSRTMIKLFPTAN
jgi:predicted PurR-regulated permease PerM